MAEMLKRKENQQNTQDPLEKLRMSGAEMIMRALRDNGVDVMFGYPGGAVLPLYDAIYNQKDIRHVLVRHEQAAVHAAEGYARSTGKVGAVIVTSGPGATNTVTGLADAMADSTPLVCITGQVASPLIGTDAFQEVDIVNITKPCTKGAFQVRDVDDLAQMIHQAFRLAQSGRPGPVVVDVPKDVQFAEGLYEPPFLEKERGPQLPAVDHVSLEQSVSLLKQAQRPVVYFGGGIISAGPKACDALHSFLKRTGFPSTGTLMGLGAVPTSDAQFLGMLGMHGTYEANMAMHDCDVMLALGARFDDRVTSRVAGFAPRAKIIQVDIDPRSINKCVKVDVSVVGDVGDVLSAFLALWGDTPKPDLSAWWSQIQSWRARRCLSYRQQGDVIKPQYALERLRALTADKDVYYTTEVGQHQMWSAQHLRFDKPRRFITSGGLGTMGYGFPAAIGVQMAHPNALVIDVAGDASIMMNIQEMATAVQYRLPVKIFVLDNQWMGMVRQWQELLHGERYSQTYLESMPDLVKLAEAFGGAGLRVEKAHELDDAIKAMMAVNDRPTIVDVCVDGAENCLPMIPAGKDHHEMLLPPAVERV